MYIPIAVVYDRYGVPQRLRLFHFTLEGTNFTVYTDYNEVLDIPAPRLNITSSNVEEISFKDFASKYGRQGISLPNVENISRLREDGTAIEDYCQVIGLKVPNEDALYKMNKWARDWYERNPEASVVYKVIDSYFRWENDIPSYSSPDARRFWYLVDYNGKCVKMDMHVALYLEKQGKIRLGNVKGDKTVSRYCYISNDARFDDGSHEAVSTETRAMGTQYSNDSSIIRDFPEEETILIPQGTSRVLVSRTPYSVKRIGFPAFVQQVTLTADGDLDILRLPDGVGALSLDINSAKTLKLPEYTRGTDVYSKMYFNNLFLESINQGKYKDICTNFITCLSARSLKWVLMSLSATASSRAAFQNRLRLDDAPNFSRLVVFNSPVALRTWDANYAPMLHLILGTVADTVYIDCKCPIYKLALEFSENMKKGTRIFIRHCGIHFLYTASFVNDIKVTFIPACEGARVDRVYPFIQFNSQNYWSSEMIELASPKAKPVAITKERWKG